MTDWFCFTKKKKENKSFLNLLKTLSVIESVVAINQPVENLFWSPDLNKSFFN